MWDGELQAEVDALYKRSDARLHLLFTKMMEENMERVKAPEQDGQYALFEVRQYLGRTVLILDNVVYPQPPIESFIDDDVA